MEEGQHPGEHDGAQMVGDAHMDAPCFQVVDVADLGLEVLVHFQDLSGHVVVAFPGVGQGQAARRAVEQACAQGLLDAL